MIRDLLIGLGIWILASFPLAVLLGKWIAWADQETRQTFTDIERGRRHP